MMKKWMMLALSVLFLAGVVSVPIGCGPGEATKIEPKEQEQPPEHANYDVDPSKPD